MMSEAVEKEKKSSGFVVIPSAVYNNRIFDIFKKVAAQVENAQVAKNPQMLGGSEYQIAIVKEGFSDGLNPFTSYSYTVEKTFSYGGDFKEFRPDTPFWGVMQKQFFLSVEDAEEHFQKIEEAVLEAVDPAENNDGEGSEQK